MIKNIACYAYSKSIRLKWSPPKFPPYFYLQIITCKLRLHSLPYLQRVFVLKSYASSSGIGFLKPKSQCQIKLTAVYNPASLDPGIHMTVLLISECELNQCKLQTCNVQLCIQSLWFPVVPKDTLDLYSAFVDVIINVTFLWLGVLMDVEFSQNVFLPTLYRSESGFSFPWLAQFIHPRTIVVFLLNWWSKAILPIVVKKVLANDQ